MAGYNSRTLPSDPDFLLALVSDIGDESESDEEFDGWRGPDDGSALVHGYSDTDEERSPSPQQHPVSADMAVVSESPLQRSTSPSHSSGPYSPTSPMPPSPSLFPTHLTPSPPTSTQHTSSRATSTLQQSAPSFTASPGIILDMEGKCPVDFFRLMFDERVLDLIFNATNRYTTQYLEREKEHLDTHPNARAHEWRKQLLTIKEIDAFIALLIAMGICGFPTLR